MSNVNIEAASRDVVTSCLLQFPINKLPRFNKLKFNLFGIITLLSHKGWHIIF